MNLFSLQKMNFYPFHLVTKQCRSSLLRRIIIVNPRLLSTIVTRQKKDPKQQENDTLAQSSTNQTELISFTQKGTYEKILTKAFPHYHSFHSSTSGERFDLFTGYYRWCCYIRWSLLSNLTRTLFKRNTKWNL